MYRQVPNLSPRGLTFGPAFTPVPNLSPPGAKSKPPSRLFYAITLIITAITLIYVILCIMPCDYLHLIMALYHISQRCTIWHAQRSPIPV